MKIKHSLALLSLLLLNSCLELQVGEIIRCPERQYDSIDATQPHKQTVYRVSSDEYIFQAPVVSSEQGARLFHVNIFSDAISSRWYKTEPKATGELLWLRAKRYPKAKTFTLQLLDKKPDLSRTTPIDSSKFSFIGDAGFPYPSNPREFTTTTRSILAAPFDYVIDPIASVPLTLAYYTGSIVAIPFVVLMSEPVKPYQIETQSAEIVIFYKIDESITRRLSD